MDLRGKKVTIIGAARSGIAAADLALALGGIPRISDARPLADIEPALAGLKDRSRVVVEAGGHTQAFIQDSDLVVASPGVWKDAAPVAWAREKNIPVWGEIELAWRYCTRPVIAVTGSNGKTTTATLIAEVLKAAGRRACLCGNVGTPFSRHVMDADVEIFVVEISSFQLELTELFRPRVAVLTNFSQNHLDRHPDMQDYFDAKRRLFMNQSPFDHAVLNFADEWARKVQGSTKAQIRFFNKDGDTGNPDHLAVLEVARVMGIADEITHKVFETFPGVEHRLERVRVLDGVTYINDSKDTTVESGRWALMMVPAPIIWICGGGGKNLEYDSLRDLARKSVKKMIILTQDESSRKTLHRTFDGVVPVEDHTDMAAAVRSARAQAVAGDKVLLSPMFTSYDMFDNFEHRGRVFKEIVNSL